MSGFARPVEIPREIPRGIPRENRTFRFGHSTVYTPNNVSIDLVSTPARACPHRGRLWLHEVPAQCMDRADSSSPCNGEATDLAFSTVSSKVKACNVWCGAAQRAVPGATAVGDRAGNDRCMLREDARRRVEKRSCRRSQSCRRALCPSHGRTLHSRS